MDGDGQQRKKYDISDYQTASGVGQHAIRHSSSSSADRFRQQQQPGPSRGATAVGEVMPQDRASNLPPYGGYGYTESQSYSVSSLQGGTSQSGGLQDQPNFSSFSRSQHQYQQPQRLSQYESDMAFNITPQAHPHSPYGTVSHYQPRNSAAIEALATQFNVPQYFQAEMPAAAGVPNQYLTAGQIHSTSYPQPTSPTRATTATTLPEIMSDFHTPSATEALGHPEFPRESSSGFDDAYNQYQHTLRQTFASVQSGRLMEASNSLLEISVWLLGNAIELGLTSDEEELHSDRIKLWNEFNTCWLAVCQKQKDITQAVLDSGIPSQNLLTEDVLNRMGRELVRMCDRLEQHGLVDYQMGVWEEEILSVLGQCLDLLERNENNPAIGISIRRTTASETQR
ncbi:uncharacterized protein PADG_06270 [Paracoccidioides brasiliensis Pb18]|uniref:Uncharacterized protein n=2 Tax=Paracoccidioides brasiliensis TaxID=121759 RepID=C1GG33_PARBD|nr:uncharacterized protein PADG_06270 [Paracoccidioides brasiliensis Pb18]EEH50191.2 hypothetical protein PADG_06270 [Paracoccidioides brasiliensis Pb18]ODH44718.1 hypothetical protein ACO22_00796 [Paracoccidioides brasiliensis]